MSQGFGIPAFPVDTHIHRLAQRWKLTNGKNVTQTEKDLKKLFPKHLTNKLHLNNFLWKRILSSKSLFWTELHYLQKNFPQKKEKNCYL